MEDIDKALAKELQFELMKEDMKQIKEFLKLIVSLKDSVLLIQEDVKGNKEFKRHFSDNVEKIVSNYISNVKNFKSLQEISDDRIKNYIMSNDFIEVINKIAEAKVKMDIKDNKSELYTNINDVISNWALTREKKLFIKIFSWLFGSLSTLIVVYQMMIGE